MSNLMAGRPSQKKAEQELSLADVTNIEPKKIKANFNIDEDLYGDDREILTEEGAVETKADRIANYKKVIENKNYVT